MTVAAGWNVDAVDYDTLAARIVAEAARRSIGAPYVPNIDPGSTIGAATFNSFIAALQALNTTGAAITLPGYKIAGQSVVYAWEAALLFSAMTTLEGTQLTCMFARNTTIDASALYMDYAGIYTGTGTDHQTDGWTTGVRFNIASNNTITINGVDIYAFQSDGPISSGPAGCTMGYRYFATSWDVVLGPGLGIYTGPTCGTEVISTNLYTSGGKERLDILWHYGLFYYDCVNYSPLWLISLTAECNGTVTMEATPHIHWTGQYLGVVDMIAVPNCTSGPLPCNGDGC